MTRSKTCASMYMDGQRAVWEANMEEGNLGCESQQTDPFWTPIYAIVYTLEIVVLRSQSVSDLL